LSGRRSEDCEIGGGGGGRKRKKEEERGRKRKKELPGWSGLEKQNARGQRRGDVILYTLQCCNSSTVETVNAMNK